MSHRVDAELSVLVRDRKCEPAFGDEIVEIEFCSASKKAFFMSPKTSCVAAAGCDLITKYRGSPTHRARRNRERQLSFRIRRLSGDCRGTIGRSHWPTS